MQCWCHINGLNVFIAFISHLLPLSGFHLHSHFSLGIINSVKEITLTNGDWPKTSWLSGNLNPTSSVLVWLIPGGKELVAGHRGQRKRTGYPSFLTRYVKQYGERRCSCPSGSPGLCLLASLPTNESVPQQGRDPEATLQDPCPPGAPTRWLAG